jgi:hypothetical protein
MPEATALVRLMALLWPGQIIVEAAIAAGDMPGPTLTCTGVDEEVPPAEQVMTAWYQVVADATVLLYTDVVAPETLVYGPPAPDVDCCH